MNSGFSLASIVACAILIALGCAAWARSEESGDFEQLPAIAELPDPLLLADGSRVETADVWQSQRAPQLKTLFQHYMYGNLPPRPPLAATVTRVDVDGFGGKATFKQINLVLGPPGAPSIDLLVVVPNGATPGAAEKPMPVILGLNFTGNHTVLADPRIAITRGWMRDGPGVVDHRPTEASRGTGVGQWEIEHSIDRGYAVATFYYGDVMPDKPDAAEGFAASLGAATAPEATGGASSGDASSTACGAIAAWGWGLERAVDYLVTDPALDAQRIVVFGHSRNGKAALVAAAFDERIAVVIPHQAGCGGTAPSRCHNPQAETVTLINQRFPHWFDGEFKKFGGHEDHLPIDQHELIALCFPRSVLLTNGTLDQWADPPGQLAALKAAGAVYRKFGVDGIDPDATAENDKRIGQRLAYFIREAPHSVDRVYWDVFLDFADDCWVAKQEAEKHEAAE